jgi:hypothetical protein
MAFNGCLDMQVRENAYDYLSTLSKSQTAKLENIHAKYKVDIFQKGKYQRQLTSEYAKEDMSGFWEYDPLKGCIRRLNSYLGNCYTAEQIPIYLQSPKIIEEGIDNLDRIEQCEKRNDEIISKLSIIENVLKIWQTNYKNWIVTSNSAEISNVYGTALGWTGKEMCYGNWYYYHKSKTLSPADTYSQALNEILSAEINYVP